MTRIQTATVAAVRQHHERLRPAREFTEALFLAPTEGKPRARKLQSQKREAAAQAYGLLASELAPHHDALQYLCREHGVIFSAESGLV